VSPPDVIRHRQASAERPPHFNRKQWRELLACEREAFSTGRWPPWITREAPKGLMRLGWATEVTSVVQNGLYVVLIRPVDAPQIGSLIHLAIRTPSNLEPPWRDLQRIKNELVGPERFAVQVCPPEAHLVDGADMYHLWVFPEGYVAAFGLHVDDLKGRGF
jgi:hypothetical protein